MEPSVRRRCMKALQPGASAVASGVASFALSVGSLMYCMLPTVFYVLGVVAAAAGVLAAAVSENWLPRILGVLTELLTAGLLSVVAWA
jgi:hypothetical protein